MTINITGIDGAFETWADMSHLIPEERHPEPPRSIAYFCASLPTPPDLPSRDEASYLADQRKRFRDTAIHYLNHEISRRIAQRLEVRVFAIEVSDVNGVLQLSREKMREIHAGNAIGKAGIIFHQVGVSQEPPDFIFFQNDRSYPVAVKL